MSLSGKIKNIFSSSRKEEKIIFLSVENELRKLGFKYEYISSFQVLDHATEEDLKKFALNYAKFFPAYYKSSIIAYKVFAYQIPRSKYPTEDGSLAKLLQKLEKRKVTPLWKIPFEKLLVMEKESQVPYTVLNTQKGKGPDNALNQNNNTIYCGM